MNKATLSTLSLFFGLPAAIPAGASEIECYDAKVWAKPVAQIPSAYPRDDDPDVIIISWPWFLDLKIQRVLDGDVERGTVTALAVMHNNYVKKNRTWLLRKNTVGMFNVVRSDSPASIRRCNPDTLPAKPYITPAPDKTYADLRREGEEEYRRYSEDD